MLLSYVALSLEISFKNHYCKLQIAKTWSKQTREETWTYFLVFLLHLISFKCQHFTFTEAYFNQYIQLA